MEVLKEVLQTVGQWFLGLSILEIGKVVLVILGLRLMTGIVIRTKGLVGKRSKRRVISSFWLLHTMLTLLSGGLTVFLYLTPFGEGCNFFLCFLSAVWFCANMGITFRAGYIATGIFD